MAFKDMALRDQRTLYKYAAGDADATRRLFFVFLQKLKEEGLVKYFKSPVMELSKTTISMSMHGVKIDFDKIADLKSLATEGRDFYLDKMIVYLSDPGFNPRSVPSLRKVLFDDLKLEYSITTAKGSPSTSSEALAEVIELNGQDPRVASFLNDLLSYRKLDKLLSTYVQKIPTFSDDRGYVHPRFIVGATVSGRVSLKDPPLTTLPKDQVYGTRQGDKLISVRSIFIPSKDSVWIHADYSQIELVVSAFLSKDPVMMAAYWAGEDLHDLTCREINGANYVTEEQAATSDVLMAERATQRRDAKIVNFSIIYLAQPYNTAKILGYPVEQVEGIMNRLFQKFSGLHKYLLNVPKVVAQEGRLVNPFGRVRHFDQFRKHSSFGAQGHEDRQAVNWNPQSCGAELTFRALNRISKEFRRRGLQSSPVILVYDAIELDVPKKELKEVSDIIVREMYRPVPEFDNYSFGFEMGIGVNMSDAEKKSVAPKNPWKKA